jgi:hypothetical protein
MYRLIWPIHVLWMLIPLQVLLVKTCSGFAGKPFVLAPNGVCLDPPYFSDGAQQFTMRNVPGEGDCMFLAVALAAATSMGLGGNDALLRAIALETRAVVSQIMNSPGNLHIEGNRIVPAKTLLLSASDKEGLTPEEYLEKLQKEGIYGGLYGGGPELTVLSNVLRRPISIYEVDHKLWNNSNTSSSTCSIQCMGVFGDIFQDPCVTSIPDSAVLSGLQPGAYSWHLHILVLDASPVEKHACVLLPQSPERLTN